MTAKPKKVSAARMASEPPNTYQVSPQEPSWWEKLKGTPEQQYVVGPLVKYLCSIGWSQSQMVFGREEWRVPKSPSELTKREKNQSYAGFPVDIVVFDDVKHLGDPRHLLFIIECKQPNESAGISQLEGYFVGEPHVKLGIWANHPHPSAPSTFIYRKSDGSMLLKRRAIADLPRPGEAIQPEAQRTTFSDLIPPPEHIFRKTVEDLLDKVVINDSNVTRREEQLVLNCISNRYLIMSWAKGGSFAQDSSDSAVFR